MSVFEPEKDHCTAPGKPGLMLVHGHAAHAHWWDFIAPAFAGDFDVVAIDLSGAGDSDHRESYTAARFGEEIVSIIEAAELTSPTVVGHSFGGTLTRIAAHLSPDAMQSVVIVDSVQTLHASATVRRPSRSATK